MKLETGIIITKGFCYVCTGVFTPWAGALAQWIGDGTWPPKIIWVGVILPLSILGGAGQLSSFLSGSFPAYMANRKMNGTTNIKPPP